MTTDFRKLLRITISLVFFVSPASGAPPRFNTTIQLPTFGVSVDADGVLEVRTFPDPDGRLRAARIAAAVAALPEDVREKSDLRKVSLVRLEQAIQRRLANGKPPGEEMLNLAGLQRLQYVFCYPDKRDIVIAGPAEGWIQDLAGRHVGVSTGRPVLELRDLLVALRTYPPGSRRRPFVGCTINPSQNGLANLQAFQETVPRNVSQRARAEVAAEIAHGSRQALGMSEARVFGIPATTHFAHVLLEADLRMKRIGIGLERPPLPMVTFLGSLQRPTAGSLQRWWFQPDYDCLTVSEDRLALQLIGQGVKLLAEDMAIGPNGKLLNPEARVGRASRLFTQSFTKKYPQISAVSPVYAQLRNCIDMLVAAAYLRSVDYYGRVDWSMPTLGSENALPTQTLAAPRQIPCNVNVVWKGNRLLSPAGGVSILPHRALDEDRWQKDENGRLSALYGDGTITKEHSRWWWD